MVHPGRVDRFVHQDVRAARQLDQVVADRRIARKHNRAGRRVEAVGKVGVHQSVRHQDGADLDAGILPDGERLHGRRRIGVRILDDAGRYHDVVRLEELPDVRHAFAAHANVQVRRHAGDDGRHQVMRTRRRVLGMDNHIVLHAWRQRGQHAARAGPNDLHGRFGAAARAGVVGQQVGQVDDVVGVQAPEPTSTM
ncbi:hypothetical protein G6F22_016788 [Rhizopus arrhizus]|nr:hypothetical protein G6F22_016788 [Rhizopus arrhizus]